MGLHLRQMIKDAAYLRQMERRVKAGDAASIAEVRGWKATEYDRLVRSRASLYGGIAWLAAIPCVFGGLSFHSDVGFIGVVVGNVLLWFGNVSQFPRFRFGDLIQDPEWINVELRRLGPNDWKNIRRVAAAPVRMEGFTLSPESERKIRDSLKSCIDGPAGLWSLTQPDEWMPVELLSTYGRDAESGEVLNVLTRQTSYAQKRPALLAELIKARDHFFSRTQRQ